jgi:Ribonuclease G/E
MADLQAAASMGLIVPHRGLERPRRDQARLRLSAPGCGTASARRRFLVRAALVYGDSDLIKRAIRDIYNPRSTR